MSSLALRFCFAITTAAAVACSTTSPASDDTAARTEPSARSSSSATPASSSASSSSLTNQAPSGKDCQAASPYSFTPTGKYRRSSTKLVVLSQGEARHHARDAITKKGQGVTLTAKFNYGKLLKDLEDEDIVFFLRDPSCAWSKIGVARTSDDGIAKLDVPAASLGVPGRYEFDAVVEGDATKASGSLWVVDGQPKAVVFDIDATLTTSDDEIIEQVLLGESPEMRADANKVVGEWAKAGWFVAYVTGRPPELTTKTRDWLRDRGFPIGYLRVTDTKQQVIPTEDGVQTFKEQALKELIAWGLQIKFAYGNALTDICAYAKAAIDPSRTFILGPHGGKACAGSSPTRALPSYTDQIAELTKLIGAP